MTTVDRYRKPPFPFPDILRSWRTATQVRLAQAHALSLRINIEDSSRLVFFSDCHRGTGGRADAFLPNKSIFLNALEYYLDDGFTYVEVGDGDEIWQHRQFEPIFAAHHEVFKLLHRFHAQQRLFLLIGNHDSSGGYFDLCHKDGIPLHQGLIMTHRPSGFRIFAVHGHQGDLLSDRFWGVSRFLARYFWRALNNAGMGHFHYIESSYLDQNYRHDLSNLPDWLSNRILQQPRRIEQRLREWAERRRLAMICGHTHLMAFPGMQSVPYFNTGSCINTGFITGLEIQQGEISLIQWSQPNGRFSRKVLHTSPLHAYKTS